MEEQTVHQPSEFKPTQAASELQSTHAPTNNIAINFCDNCHARVQGKFCSQCGQSLESSLKYFWTVILHLLDDIFSFDSRASRTVTPLFFKPGFLTNEYIAGKRVHYVPPLRLYIFISIIFFLSLKLFSDSATSEFGKVHSAYTEYTTFMKDLETEIADTSEDEKRPLLQMQSNLQRLAQDLQAEKSSVRYRIAKRALDIQLNRFKGKEQFSNDELAELAQLSEKLTKIHQGLVVEFDDPTFSIGKSDGSHFNISFLSEESNQLLNKKGNEIEAKIEKQMAENPAKLLDYALGKLPQLMFVILPLFAVLLKFMYLFSKRLYMEHLTVALHSHSFIFLAILFIEVCDFCYDNIKPSYPFIADSLSYLGFGTLIWLPIYLFLMQKRVYKQGYLFTFFKYSIIGTIYSLLIVFTGLAAFLWGVIEA